MAPFFRWFQALGVYAALILTPGAAFAQFDQIPVPSRMSALDFMVGEWAVEGAFRTPDHVLADRTLWYLTRGGGVTSFRWAYVDRIHEGTISTRRFGAPAN